MLAGRHDDAGVHLERLAQAVPRAVQRRADEIAVLPVPVVVDVELGVLQPAVEVVVARVRHVRQELAEAPDSDLLLPQRFLEAEQEPAVAVLVLEEPDLGVEVLAGLPVLESNPVMTVVPFRVDVVGVVASGQTRRFGAGDESRTS